MRPIACLSLLFAATTSFAADVPTPEQVQFFESRVRPLLAEHCQGCHGAKKKNGGLRLDSAAAIRTGGDSGPLLHPTDPDSSVLLRAVRHEGDLKMPKNKLPAAQIDILARWVKMGAPWPAAGPARPAGGVTAAERSFWSFQPVRDPPVPTVTQPHLAQTSIDRFLLAALEARGLTPVRLADRRVLIRRLTFDLTGLPPTPDEVEAFVQDSRPDAYARLVDRLLATPAYGERWGRHWLDVVRYADTAGDNSDYPIPQHHLYRNWVLAAFNEDRPYDQFVREQVAGDLLLAATQQVKQDRLIATGYLANVRRFGSYEDKRYQWYLTYEDAIENLGRAFLGLGLSCARCHDHKFDPISMADYYGLYGIFRSTQFPWPGIELDKVQRDLISLATPEQEQSARQARKHALDELDQQIRKLEKGARSAEEKRTLGDVRKRREKLAKSPLPIPMAYVVAEGKRWVGNARIHLKGDPQREGREVPRGFLHVLGGQTLPSDAKGSGRLQLAEWLTDAKNPLFARVMVNRVWQYHFGRGLVPTPNDFGKQGQPPSHPELLDWLATRFSADGWSVKSLHRRIVLSRAYQLSSDDDARAQIADPENALHWRFNRRRLDAESIRDALLAVSGELDRSQGGGHPFPAMTSWNFTQHNPFKAVYETDRRSVYLMVQRIQRHPYLALFDGPDTNASTGKRLPSTTPLQALYFMNDPFAGRMARGLAARLQSERSDETGRIDLSFRLAFGRSPTEVEENTAREFLTQLRERVSETNREGRAWESYARALLMSNELVYVD